MWAGQAAAGGRRALVTGAAGTQSLTVFADDVDAHYARAKAAAAKILEEPRETEYGEYQYAARDLYGHHWLFSKHVKDRSPEEWRAEVKKKRK